MCIRDRRSTSSLQVDFSGRRHDGSSSGSRAGSPGHWGPMVQSASRPVRVPLPRRWPVRASDIVAILVANGVLIVAMWVRHGGSDHLTSPGAILTAAGQVTALLGTYLALIQLVLMSR